MKAPIKPQVLVKGKQPGIGIPIGMLRRQRVQRNRGGHIAPLDQGGKIVPVPRSQLKNIATSMQVDHMPIGPLPVERSHGIAWYSLPGPLHYLAGTLYARRRIACFRFSITGNVLT
ncbi:MAG TPA: hypothetical protein VF026_00625 [Ktedonobacteraceae bacterium]